MARYSLVVLKVPLNINQTNEEIVSLCAFLWCSEASLTTLKQMAPLKLQQIPQLTALLPYIDLAPNQEYLVSRIRGQRILLSDFAKSLFYFMWFVHLNQLSVQLSTVCHVWIRKWLMLTSCYMAVIQPVGLCSGTYTWIVCWQLACH